MSWLKFDVSTPEKPEVMAITIALGYDDPDLTVGKLLKVWRWFDSHTQEGNAVGVTPSLLDKVVGIPGMCAAMESVGWIVVSASGVTIPNFDRHNGKTAKERALGAKRAALHKSNAKSNDRSNGDSVTYALPREEKSREEKKEHKEPSGSLFPASRKTKLPSGFYPNETGIQKAEDSSVNVAIELAKFTDYHRAKGSTMADWQAAWRTWVGNAATFSRAGPANRQASIEARNKAAGEEWLRQEGVV